MVSTDPVVAVRPRVDVRIWAIDHSNWVSCLLDFILVESIGALSEASLDAHPLSFD